MKLSVKITRFIFAVEINYQAIKFGSIFPVQKRPCVLVQLFKTSLCGKEIKVCCAKAKF